MIIDETDEVVRLEAACDRLLSMIPTIPDGMLDWIPDNGEWSVRQILGHLAHANDFYCMIFDGTRSAAFGEVQLQPETGRVVARCRTSRRSVVAWHLPAVTGDRNNVV